MRESDHKITLKIILVGDNGCGKQSLVNRFAHNKFTSEKPKHTFVTETVQMQNDEIVRAQYGCIRVEDINTTRQPANFWDNMDCVIFVFDTQKPWSLEDVRSRLVAMQVLEYKHDTNTDVVPWLVAGTKIDMVDSEQLAKAESTAKALGPSKYLSTSAKTNTKVTTLFEAALRKAYNYHYGIETTKLGYADPLTEDKALKAPYVPVTNFDDLKLRDLKRMCWIYLKTDCNNKKYNKENLRKKLVAYAKNTSTLGTVQALLDDYNSRQKTQATNLHEDPYLNASYKDPDTGATIRFPLITDEKQRAEYLAGKARENFIKNKTARGRIKQHLKELYGETERILVNLKKEYKAFIACKTNTFEIEGQLRDAVGKPRMCQALPKKPYDKLPPEEDMKNYDQLEKRWGELTFQYLHFRQAHIKCESRVNKLREELKELENKKAAAYTKIGDSLRSINAKNAPPQEILTKLADELEASRKTPVVSSTVDVVDSATPDVERQLMQCNIERSTLQITVAKLQKELKELKSEQSSSVASSSSSKSRVSKSTKP